MSPAMGSAQSWLSGGKADDVTLEESVRLDGSETDFNEIITADLTVEDACCTIQKCLRNLPSQACTAAFEAALKCLFEYQSGKRCEPAESSFKELLHVDETPYFFLFKGKILQLFRKALFKTYPLCTALRVEVFSAAMRMFSCSDLAHIIFESFNEIDGATAGRESFKIMCLSRVLCRLFMNCSDTPLEAEISCTEEMRRLTSEETSPHSLSDSKIVKEEAPVKEDSIAPAHSDNEISILLLLDSLESHPRVVDALCNRFSEPYAATALLIFTNRWVAKHLAVLKKTSTTNAEHPGKKNKKNKRGVARKVKMIVSGTPEKTGGCQAVSRVLSVYCELRKTVLRACKAWADNDKPVIRSEEEELQQNDDRVASNEAHTKTSVSEGAAHSQRYAFLCKHLPSLKKTTALDYKCLFFILLAENKAVLSTGTVIPLFTASEQRIIFKTIRTCIPALVHVFSVLNCRVLFKEFVRTGDVRLLTASSRFVPKMRASDFSSYCTAYFQALERHRGEGISPLIVPAVSPFPDRFAVSFCGIADREFIKYISIAMAENTSGCGEEGDEHFRLSPMFLKALRVYSSIRGSSFIPPLQIAETLFRLLREGNAGDVQLWAEQVCDALWVLYNIADTIVPPLKARLWPVAQRLAAHPLFVPCAAFLCTRLQGITINLRILRQRLLESSLKEDAMRLYMLLDKDESASKSEHSLLCSINPSVLEVFAAFGGFVEHPLLLLDIITVARRCPRVSETISNEMCATNMSNATSKSPFIPHNIFLYTAWHFLRPDVTDRFIRVSNACTAHSISTDLKKAIGVVFFEQLAECLVELLMEDERAVAHRLLITLLGLLDYKEHPLGVCILPLLNGVQIDLGSLAESADGRALLYWLLRSGAVVPVRVVAVLTSLGHSAYLWRVHRVTVINETGRALWYLAARIRRCVADIVNSTENQPVEARNLSDSIKSPDNEVDEQENAHLENVSAIRNKDNKTAVHVRDTLAQAIERQYALLMSFKDECLDMLLLCLTFNDPLVVFLIFREAATLSDRSRKRLFAHCVAHADEEWLLEMVSYARDFYAQERRGPLPFPPITI